MRESAVNSVQDASLQGIDAGERAAIELAGSLNADLLLMDDCKGIKAAQKKGLRVTGTLGVLEQAALQGLFDLAQAFTRLRQTKLSLSGRPHAENACRKKLTVENNSSG